MNKFTVFYTDNTQFSGDPFKKDWIKIDESKQIVKLEYVLGNCNAKMSGFKQYNHCKERLGLQVKGYGKVILFGRTDGNSLLIIFDLLKNEIYKITKPYGQEYGKQIIAGWQRGKLNNPEAFINGKKIYPNVLKVKKT